MNEQETPSFQIYTIFGSSGFWMNNCPMFKGEMYGASLERLMQVAEQDYGVTPIAWAAEGTIRYHGTKYFDTLCAESIAAGRLIEKTPSGWVALGAEKQEDELRKGEPTSAVQAEPAFLKELRDLVAIQGANGNWNHDDYMCGLYNGLELALATAEGRGARYRSLSAPVVVQAPVSTAKPNPFPTTLRSPDCDSGPSDHLNASRHQMAAKQFHKA